MEVGSSIVSDRLNYSNLQVRDGSNLAIEDKGKVIQVGDGDPLLVIALKLIFNWKDNY